MDRNEARNGAWKVVEAWAEHPVKMTNGHAVDLSDRIARALIAAFNSGVEKAAGAAEGYDFEVRGNTFKLGVVISGDIRALRIAEESGNG